MKRDKISSNQSGPNKSDSTPSQKRVKYQTYSSNDHFLKRIRNWTMLLFVLSALIMVIVTWFQIHQYFATGGDVTIWLVAALLAGFILCFTFVVFVAYQLIRKREKFNRLDSVESPLYLRLLRHLSFMALIPAIVTAGIGTSIIVVLGERIFSEIRIPMDNATRAAISYIESQYHQQNQSITNLSQSVADKFQNLSFVTTGELRQILQKIPETSPFDHTFIVNRLGNVISRGNDSYLFDCDTVATQAIKLLGSETSNTDLVGFSDEISPPCQTTQNIGTAEAFQCYQGGDITDRLECPQPSDGELVPSQIVSSVVFRREGSDKLYSLTRLKGINELFVYGQTQINAEILQLYIASQLNSSNKIISRLAIEVLIWSLIYVVLLAILLSLMLVVSTRIAKQVSRPVQELARLADRVKEDDRNVEIPIFEGSDEIARLGRSFKEMVERLVERQNKLELQYTQEEAERRKFDSVLETVSAGVIGLDEKGNVTFFNKAAKEMLEANFEKDNKIKHLSEISPSFYAEWVELVGNGHDGLEAHRKLTFIRHQSTIELLVRAVEWHGHQTHDANQKQYVVSIDDVTRLTESERARFAVEAARQIAHDLKSPLQAAKFAMSNMDALLSEDAKQTIRNQFRAIDSNLNRVTDLVNRFKIPGVLGEIVLDIHEAREVFAQFVKEAQQRRPNINFVLEADENTRILVRMDKRSMRDVFENLIKNAIDSIKDYRENGRSSGTVDQYRYREEIRIHIQPTEKQTVIISVSDNGAGLPKEKIDFTAAGVSTRGPRRGRGLTIVEAMVKKHKGKFSLKDAPIFDGNHHVGAQAVIELPLCSPRNLPNGLK